MGGGEDHAWTAQALGLIHTLVDVSDIFYFFCSGAEEVAGGLVLIKNRGRGGGVMRRGGVGGEGGGRWAKYFFSGRNVHQDTEQGHVSWCSEINNNMGKQNPSRDI